MARVNNPRFPHHCRILRYAETSPMSDEKYFLSDVSIPSDFNDDFNSDFKPQSTLSVIYQGVCRSDNRDTISDNGEVIASYRTLSLPTVQQDWTDENIPREGDRIELQRFGYTEYGQVIDRRPSNLGTHILWKYDRN